MAGSIPWTQPDRWEYTRLDPAGFRSTLEVALRRPVSLTDIIGLPCRGRHGHDTYIGRAGTLTQVASDRCPVSSLLSLVGDRLEHWHRKGVSLEKTTSACGERVGVRDHVIRTSVWPREDPGPRH